MKSLAVLVLSFDAAVAVLVPLNLVELLGIGLGCTLQNNVLQCNPTHVCSEVSPNESQANVYRFVSTLSKYMVHGSRLKNFCFDVPRWLWVSYHLQGCTTIHVHRYIDTLLGFQ